MCALFLRDAVFITAKSCDSCTSVSYGRMCRADSGSAALIKNVILVPHGIADNAGAHPAPVLCLTGDTQLGNAMRGVD